MAQRASRTLRATLPGLVACLAALAGCASLPSGWDRAGVSGAVHQRTGFSLATPPAPGQVFLPNGVDLDAPLTEEAAVLVALWNNAAFQERLVELGLAHADLVQAGLLPNPEFGYFFPVTDKPYKYVLDLPLEAFWLRPIRVAGAARESARVGEALTQAALDLIRDVRQAYADVVLAHARRDVAQEAVRVRGEVARLAEARFRAGDLGEQEAATARIDSLQAQQDAVRIAYDIDLACERLRNLLGLGADRRPLKLAPAPPPAATVHCIEELVAEALVARPDMLAAGEAVVAAEERLRLARLSWFRLLGILDATSGTRTGHEFGPGLRLTVPLFNSGQGGVARAEAEREQAVRRKQTLRDLIIQEVNQAHLRYRQALAEQEVLEGRVRPEVEAAIRRAEAGYREGNTAYVVVLETTRQLLDAHLRRALLHADLRRAWADLERSVGRHLDQPRGRP